MADQNNDKRSARALDTAELYQHCDPEMLSFRSTDELPDLEGTVGQARAQSALEFATRVAGDGYNLYVLGRSGSHKHKFTIDFLENEARRRGPASDWCYLNNFNEGRKPIAVELPAGRGSQLRDDMTHLIAELSEVIPATFEGDHYRNRVAEINQAFEDRHKEALQELQAEAAKDGLSVVSTPQGFAIAPVRDGHVVPDEEFDKLPESEKERTKQAIARMTERIKRHFQAIPAWQKEHRDAIRKLNREVVELSTGQLIDPLDVKYQDHEELREYLKSVREDVLENARDFLPSTDQGPLSFSQPSSGIERYQVNMIVDNGGATEAPIVYEQNPSLQNLIGRIEHLAQFGALLTDYTMIRPGALHRANGGYLILDAERILTQPFSWSALKRALFTKEIRMESLDQYLSIATTVSLEPEPVELDIKVVLIGDRRIYYLLCELDNDFANLFKVAADFEDRIDRTAENTTLYARLIATLAREENLQSVSRDGVARLIERSARLAARSDKLSTELRSIADLLREADYFARQEEAEAIGAYHVEKAVDAQIHRADRLRAQIQEGIQRNLILIDTEGFVTGQVNGLSVYQLGNFAFGKPTRITATVRIGAGKIIDIERETELGGPIHSKGVLILSSYLASKYATDLPLSLSASLVFEQSYGGIEGDSASVAETCALLSALAECPIRQELAVTGSVNQHGKVQAIGGANEKIEGFYDVCKARGLTGTQGCLIPEENVTDLMLRDDLIEDVRAGHFNVYSISTIDDAIGLLTGIDAGARDAEGRFPPESVNSRVEQRLTDLAHARRRFGRSGKENSGGSDESIE